MAKKKLVDSKESGGFVCMICGERSHRGHLIAVRLGPHKGKEVKVCRQAECIILAALGEY
jgi:hypothetical protein